MFEILGDGYLYKYLYGSGHKHHSKVRRGLDWTGFEVFSIFNIMASIRIIVVFLSLALLHPSTSSNSIKESSTTSLKSLLKTKDLSLKKVSLSDAELKKYVPLAIEELEAELLKALETGKEHHREKRTLIKKKLIFAKLLLLKALIGGGLLGGLGGLGGHKGGGGGGYGYGPPKPSYGPPPAPSYGPPPAPSYGPPMDQGYSG